MDIALFMPQDYNSQGDPKYNYWQRILTVDSYNPSELYEEVETVTDWYLPDIHTEMGDLYEADAPDVNGSIENYLVDAARLLSKTTGRNIVACGQLVKKYNSMTDEEDYYTQLYWRHPVVKNYLGEVIFDEI